MICFLGQILNVRMTFSGRREYAITLISRERDGEGSGKARGGYGAARPVLPMARRGKASLPIAAAQMGRGLKTGRQRSIMHRAARKPRAPLDATTTVSISCRDHQARV